MRQIDDPVRLRRRAANLERALAAAPARESTLAFLRGNIGGSPVCTRLAAGGRRIRTLGPPVRERSVVAPCTRRAASLRRLVAHPTVQQHTQRRDESERLV